MGTSAWNVPYILIIVHLHRQDVQALFICAKVSINHVTCKSFEYFL